MIRRTAPYGSWKSPVTPDLLVTQAVGLSDLSVTDGVAYWVESRPSEGGRQVLVAAPLAEPEGHIEEVTPHGFSVRTQVHEYGGRCYAVHETTVVFSNWEDQRLWLVRAAAGGDVDATAWSLPEPLTPEPPSPRAVRFADPVIDASGRWVVCVRERHQDDGSVDNDLVAIPLPPPLITAGDPTEPLANGTAEPVVLADGHDFYAAPRLSPDSSRLAWISWDQPAMPWDSTALTVGEVQLGDPDTPDPKARVADAAVIADGPNESVIQPRWSPDGVLHYVSDRSGWWNIYDEHGHAVVPAEAEFAGPDWVFGLSSYGFEPSGGLVAEWSGPDTRGIGRLGPGAERPGAFEPTDFGFTGYSYLAPIEGGVLAIVTSPVTAAAIARLRWACDAVEIIRESQPALLPSGIISTPEHVQFPTGAGEVAYAWFYAPVNENFEAPAGERPPLVVMIHGGPTSAARASFSLAVQFWTSRGFAVADVDYRGSSGYGRAFRKKLDGAWGIADIEDCAAVVTELDRRGLVDGQRAVIRGGSAGGFTTLAALAFTDRFSAGASHFGVADLELLARDTHKFEARYLDGIVAPWPDGIAVYRERSPIHHVDAITSPLILFQGLEDKIVPPEQAELMYEALKGRGIPVCHMAFEGEQHGFRKAETITTVIAAELLFYGLVLGFEPDLAGTVTLEVANREAL